MKSLKVYIKESLRKVLQYEGLEITRDTLEEILSACGFTSKGLTDQQAIQVLKEAQKVFTSNKYYIYKDSSGAECKTASETALQVYINSYDSDRNPTNPDIIQVVSKDILKAFTEAAQKYDLKRK